ncbi:MAG TPA: hypothetical protein VF181_07560 [Balneolaceae bacterium]
MPVQSRWMIRFSLVYLTVGVSLGVVMLVHKAFPIHPAVWLLLPVHIQILIWGWIIQFTLGTAYWILPRFLKGASRGNEAFSWLVVIALNAGILLNLLSFILGIPLLGKAGLILQTISVALFVLSHWKRITSYNK